MNAEMLLGIIYVIFRIVILIAIIIYAIAESRKK